MTKVLIIGGTGYIGSALYKHLRRVNEIYAENFVHGPYTTIDTVDLEWFGNFVNPNNLIMDYNHLTKEQLSKYDSIVLLAAHSSPAVCDKSGAHSVINNNVRNFVDILPKLSEHQKFIYASSITVYQGQQETEIDEEQPLIVNTPSLYDFSKKDCDYIMTLNPHVQFYGLRFATLSGISDNWRTDIMVNAMTNTAINEAEVRVFNPMNHKAILYMQDLVRAIATIIESPNDNRGFYNLASYNGITEEIAEVIADITNTKLKVISSADMIKIGLPTTAYDIAISTKKFESVFNFKFSGSTERITNEIISEIDHVHPTKRTIEINYI